MILDLRRILTLFFVFVFCLQVPALMSVINRSPFPTGGLITGVSRKLVVSLRDADSMPAGVVRSYISSLYQDVYDAAIAARRPELDVRVLLPLTATIGATRGGGSSSASTSNTKPSKITPVATPKHAVLAGGGTHAVLAGGGGVAGTDAFHSSSSPSFGGGGGGDGGGNAGWATLEAAKLEPELEVLFSDEPRGGHKGSLNADRARAGFRPVDVVSLESVATGAYKPDYFYAEDVLAGIPTFANVRASTFCIAVVPRGCAVLP